MIELKLQSSKDIIERAKGMGLNITKKPLASLLTTIKVHKYEIKDIVNLLDDKHVPIIVIQYLMCLYGIGLSEAKMIYEDNTSKGLS